MYFTKPLCHGVARFSGIDRLRDQFALSLIEKLGFDRHNDPNPSVRLRAILALSSTKKVRRDFTTSDHRDFSACSPSALLK